MKTPPKGQYVNFLKQDITNKIHDRIILEELELDDWEAIGIPEVDFKLLYEFEDAATELPLELLLQYMEIFKLELRVSSNPNDAFEFPAKEVFALDFGIKVSRE